MTNLSLSSLKRLFASRRNLRRGVFAAVSRSAEPVEQRLVMSADSLPVLMVIADQRDFYYQEYGDTRSALEAAGLQVHVAATPLAPSVPHAGTGQGTSDGIVVPDIALSDVNPDNDAAIAFVGGWGSSMYQYAFSGDYSENLYDDDLATKQAVNELINDFVVQDKHVAAICHGVTVLAWARVDGRIITAENYDSAAFFGTVIAQEVLAAADPVENHAHVANDVQFWMNGTACGSFVVSTDSRVIVRGAAGNDQIFATDLSRPVSVYGEEVHDLITGGSAADLLDDGAGVDRISGLAGDDIIRGGEGYDFLFGDSGNDILIGNEGTDHIDGGWGNDILIGGQDSDSLNGGADDDLLIGGITSFDDDDAALREIQSVWMSWGSIHSRSLHLATGTASGFRLTYGTSLFDDRGADVAVGGSGADLMLISALDRMYADADDLFAVG